MILLNDWKGCSSAEAVFCDFVDYTDKEPLENKPEFKDVEILLASYEYENYEGEAFVLFRRDGKLWEVNASHCSCYGLENQWEPEETTIDALRHRLDKGSLGRAIWCSGNRFANELRDLLDELEKK